MRRRFLVTCMKSATALERELVSKFSKQLLDWRWESLGHLLDKLVPITPTLQKYWDAGALQKTGDSLSATDNGRVAAVDKLLLKPWVHPTFEMLRVIAHVVNSWGGWLEGCRVHNPDSSADDVGRGCNCHGGRCPFKGARGAEMVTGASVVSANATPRVC